MKIKDSVYLVTGGASGLGKATAEKLLADGANVAIIDLQSPPENDPLRAYGEKVHLFQVDISSEKEVLNALDVLKRKFGKLNGLINCAGMFVSKPTYDFEKKEPHSLQEFTTVVNINLIGTFNVIRLSIPLLAENEPDENGDRGIIITTSSITGHVGKPNIIAYSATKAGIIGMVVPLAKELESYGIRVIDIAPGSFDTPLLRDFWNTHRKGVPLPLQTLGRPSQYGDFVKNLIENSAVNGTSIKFHRKPE